MIEFPHEMWSVADRETGMWAGICPNHMLQLFSKPQIGMCSTDKLTAVRRALSLNREFYPRVFEERRVS